MKAAKVDIPYETSRRGKLRRLAKRTGLDGSGSVPVDGSVRS